MNANELADELREVSKRSEPHTKIVLCIAESLLRQQQAALIAEQEHNEMLEAELKAMREQLNANQV